MIFDEKLFNSLCKKYDVTTIETIRKYGYCHLSEIYINEVGQEIKIEVYELKSRTYLIKFVAKECVLFKDITVTNK